MSLLLPYQKRIVNDPSQKICVIAARQIGKTTAARVKIALDFLDSKTKSDWWVASQDERHAQLFLKGMKKTILGIGRLTKSHIKFNCNATTLERRGKIVGSLSSNPDTHAGLVGNRYLDEFAVHEQSEELWNIAIHGTTWGGKMLVTSTPREANSAFFNLVQKSDEYGVSVHRITLNTALEEGFLERLKRNLPKDSPILSMDNGAYYDYIRRGCLTEMSFRREMLCEWEGGSDGILSKEDVEGCLGRFQVEGDTYVLGIDVGHGQDFTVITKCKYEIANTEQGWRYYIESLWVKKTMTFKEIKEKALSMMTSACRAVAIDSTGIGMQVAEELATEGALRDIPVYKTTFDNETKMKLALDFKKAIDGNYLAFKELGVDLVSDLCSVKETINASNSKIDAKRSGNGHGDRFWSIALAIRAARYRGI